MDGWSSSFLSLLWRLTHLTPGITNDSPLHQIILTSLNNLDTLLSRGGSLSLPIQIFHVIFEYLVRCPGTLLQTFCPILTYVNTLQLASMAGLR